jgi:hypothetical protein
MQASGDSQSDGSDELERELRRALYRFDCPDAHELGEYQLDLLDAEHRTSIAAHALECDECSAELQLLRSFLAAPVAVPDSVTSRVRRIVATLFAPNAGLAYGGLRGAADTSTRVYEAGDITVSLGPGATSGSVFGLVVAADQPPDALDGREVRLQPRDGSPTRAVLDDIGNFEFTGVAAGAYVLEIDLPDGIVVIEELRVD